MNSISKLCSAEEIELEREREELRDLRWNRRRSMIFVGGWWSLAIVAAIKAPVPPSWSVPGKLAGATLLGL